MTNGWKVGAIAVVVGIGTYVGLKLLLPHHKVEVVMEGLVPADSVFGAKLKSPTEVASAAAAAQTPGAAEASSAATTPNGPAVNTDDATAAPVADNAAPSAEASPAAPEPASAPTEAPAAPAPPAEAAPAPAPAAEPPPPAPKPAKPAAPKASGPSGAAKSASPAASTPWWQTSGGDGLHVVYVGSAAYKRAIVVMGSAPFGSADSASKNIQVVGAGGKRVGGAWEINRNNPTMLVLPVDANGRYQLTIGAALADAQGRKLGKSLKGAVLVE